MKKKILGLVLAVSTALSLCTFSVGAEPAGQVPEYAQSGADSVVLQAVSFTDVQAGAWFYDAVSWAVDHNITSGIGNNLFAPNNICTREQIVTFLWNKEGQPEPAGTGQTFTDVEPGAWYEKAVLWAVEQGITSGYPDGTFGVGKNCTREAAVTFLWNQAGQPAVTGKNPFSDLYRSAWYYQAVLWGVSQSITSGYPNGTFGVGIDCSRAAIVQFLYNQKTKTPTPLEPETADRTDQIEVGGIVYTIGQSVRDLSAPEEQLASLYGWTWYLYDTDTYQNFLAAGVQNGEVVALLAAGPGFTYQGVQCGETMENYDDTDDFECYATIAVDLCDNNIVHSVFLSANGYRRTREVTTALLEAESKLNFHLTNAFRAYHGLGILSWSTQAATSARLHSEDMAANQYFSHTGLNGSEVNERMEAQGIEWSACGENIAYGGSSWNPVPYGGFDAYKAWINSYGHRDNMLDTDYNRMGVGAGYYSVDGNYFYFTQNFWASR